MMLLERFMHRFRHLQLRRPVLVTANHAPIEQSTRAKHIFHQDRLALGNWGSPAVFRAPCCDRGFSPCGPAILAPRILLLERHIAPFHHSRHTRILDGLPPLFPLARYFLRWFFQNLPLFGAMRKP
jgi:hypothetical protein